MVDDRPLWSHQASAIERGKTQKELCLWFDMGCGKSRTLIEILRYRYNQHKKILRTIIVCPSAVVLNWMNEFSKFSNIPKGKIIPLTGSLAQREKILLVSPEDTIFITNYEAFAFPKFVDSVMAISPHVLCLDEVHRIKEVTSKRTKALIKVSDKMRAIYRDSSYFYQLTGTPVLNSQMDLYAQMRILDGGKTLGSNYFEFRGRFFYNKNAAAPKHVTWPNWVPRSETTESLKQKISSVSVTAKKSECLSLPPLLRTEFLVDISKEQKRAYEEMKKDFISFLDSGIATANLAVTKLLRMQQILSGHIKLEDGTIHIFKDNPRIEGLQSILSDISSTSKCIVWCIFKADYEAVRKVCESLGIDCVEVTGEVNTKEKQDALDRFDKDPKCRVMIGSPAAGGVGVSMVAADTAIYYSRSFSLADDLQSEARCHRGGSEQHEKITRIDIVAKGTIDELIMSALRDKKNLADQILDLKNYL